MVFGLLSGKLREPAECVIRVGDEEISDLYPVLVEVLVETSRAEASAATITFETRRDETGLWVVQDRGVLAPWQPIVIEAAFGTYTEEVMRGYILRVNPTYPQDPGDTKVIVKCQDDSVKLDREQVRTTWGNDAPTSDLTIVTQIVTDHSLLMDGDSKEGQTSITVSQDKTDIRFLKDRAEANGYELIFREGKVYFGPMRVDKEAQETILVYAGPDTHCFSFDVDDDGHRPDKVAYDIAASAGDATETEIVAPNLPLMGPTPATGGDGLRDFVWRLSREGGSDRNEAAARAQGKANEQSMKIRATGKLDGSRYGHVLRAGEPVPVDGIGERYGGVYYVDKVSHRFTVDGYRQSFELMRNAYGDNLGDLPGPGALGAVMQ